MKFRLIVDDLFTSTDHTATRLHQLRYYNGITINGAETEIIDSVTEHNPG